MSGAGQMTPNEGPSGGGAMTAMEYERLVQIVGRNILTLNTNATRLEGLLSKLGTEQDTPDFRQSMQQLQQNSLELIRATKNRFVDLEKRQPASTKTDQVQHSVQIRRMREDFTTAVDKFKSAQTATIKKQKEYATRSRAASSPVSQDFYGDNTWGVPEGQKTGPGYEQLSLLPADPQLALMAERERDVRKIETDIVAINDIMTDLANLVHEQGETIDTIETHVELAYDNVEAGGKNLESAAKSKSKWRKKKCILLLLLLLLIAIIAVIIGVTIDQNNKKS